MSDEHKPLLIDRDFLLTLQNEGREIGDISEKRMLTVFEVAAARLYPNELLKVQSGYSHGTVASMMRAVHMRVMRQYEAKLASGELRVVVKATNTGHEFTCSNCKFQLADTFQLPADEYDKPWNFCPGCGAQIVKP